MRAAGAVAYRAWYGVDDDARPQEGMVGLNDVFVVRNDIGRNLTCSGDAVNCSET